MSEKVVLEHDDLRRTLRRIAHEIAEKNPEPTRLAVLDHALVLRSAPWPQIGVELFNRGTRRAHHLAVGDDLEADALLSGADPANLA